MEVLMPQLGETVAEGKITKWFKAAGMTLEDLPMIENPLQFRNHITAR